MSDRLRRLLLVVPAARARPGIRLGELAQSLACTEDELRRDIDLLAMVGAPPFNPDDLIDIELRDDRVYVSLPQSFDQPTRLIATEAAALAVAASALAPDDEVTRSAVRKLSQAVASTQRELYEGLVKRLAAEPSTDGDDVGRMLSEAIQQRREVEILYFAPSELAARPRVVRPRAMPALDGVRYLSAQRDDGQERIYRVDRIARASLTDTTFDPLPPIDLQARLEQIARFEANADLPRAVIRFSPKVADAARARHRHSPNQVANDDGSVDISVPYASLTWLVSYVLSWSGQAEPINPPEARQAMRDAIDRALEAHGD